MLFWEEFLSNVFVWLKTFSLFCVSVISVKLQINNKTELFHYLSKELKNERRELPEGELICIGSFLLTFICSHLGRLFRGKLLLTASSLRVTAVDLRPPSHPPTSSGVFFLPPVRAGVWKLRLLPVARVGRGRTKARLKAAQMSSHSCEPLSLIGGKTHRKRRKTGVEVAVWTMCPSVDDSVFAANRRRFVAEKAHWSQMMLWPDKQQFGQKVAPCLCLEQSDFLPHNSFMNIDSHYKSCLQQNSSKKSEPSLHFLLVVFLRSDAQQLHKYTDLRL